jgi:hypothetical protein
MGLLPWLLELDGMQKPGGACFALRGCGSFMSVSLRWPACSAAIPGLGAVLAMAACAGTLPAHLVDPKTHPDYPPERFLTAIGRSVRSANEAEADARRVIAERIRSDIVSLSESVEREGSQDGKVSSSTAYLLSVRSEARFSHGELIRVDQGLGARHDGEYHAFAYASVAELSRVLSSAYDAQATAFRAAARSAESAGSLPEYAAAYQLARAAYLALARTAFEHRAVTGRDPRAFGDDTLAHRALGEGRARRLSGIRVAPRVDGLEAADRSRLEGLFARALASLGVAVEAGACEGALALAVRAAPDCSRRSLGHHCGLSLRAALGPCGASEPWLSMELTDPAWKGASVRNEGEARTALWATVGPEDLARQLRAAMSSALPLE